MLLLTVLFKEVSGVCPRLSFGFRILSDIGQRLQRSRRLEVVSFPMPQGDAAALVF